MKDKQNSCIILGCDRQHHARGYCFSHYAQFKRGHLPSELIKGRVMQKLPECQEDGCLEPVKAKGLCKMHYQRFLRHGHVKDRTRVKPFGKCIIEKCDNNFYAKGLCHAHYIKERKWQSLGVDARRYQEMLREQNNVCAICGKPERNPDKASGKIKDLAIDHNHATGNVRALLCSNCNTALGLFADDPALLAKAQAYVLRYEYSGSKPSLSDRPSGRCTD